MNTNTPLISVVLPIYNVKKYLNKCMNSVLKQTYKNIEIIMVDDGSTDGSGEYCEVLAGKDDRIIVYHKTNGGLSDARNYGIARSKGKYITCVDSDDYIDEDYVDYLFQLIVKYDTRMSICQHRVVSEKNYIKDYGSFGDEKMSSVNCIERMLYHDIIDTSAWAKMYEKSLFDDIKYPKGKLYEDIATTYKLFIKSSSIAVGYESKYNYIIRKTSIVNSEFNIGKFDLLDMTDKMAKDVKNEFPELMPAIVRRRVYARFSTLNQMLNINDYHNERKKIIDFIKKNRRYVLCNKRAPFRDKLAIILLSINYKLYKLIWTLALKKKYK